MLFTHATFRNARTASARGFSLVELLVVMAITGVLTALLLPTLASVRENANRVISSSNQRTIGQGLTMYASDFKDELPRSRVIEGFTPRPEELMVARFDSTLNPVSPMAMKNRRSFGPIELDGWDGIGLLYARHYVDDADVFYCPSHTGEHRQDRYADNWKMGHGTIYTNYHYAGHIDWTNSIKRRFASPSRLVLLTDGLRRRSDLSHQTGLNVLKGDGSVRWHELPTLLARLPMEDPIGQAEIRAHQDLINELFNEGGLIK